MEKKEVPMVELNLTPTVPIIRKFPNKSLIDIRYSLISPFTAAHVYWDKDNSELLYDLEEPILNDQEIQSLALIKNALREVVNLNVIVEKTEDEGYEKHVPVVEKNEGNIKVKVGSVPHPMEEKHYIQWIEIIADGKAYRQFLSPGDKPEAEFEISANELIVHEYCNIHGLWKA